MEGRRWRARLLEACQRGVDDLVEHDDPFQRHLLADLIDLRDRLRAELDLGDRG